MRSLEVSGAVRPLKWPLGVKWLNLTFALELLYILDILHKMGRAETCRIPVTFSM
jgi:hypothetical protein